MSYNKFKEAVDSGAALYKACVELGISKRTYNRWKNTDSDYLVKQIGIYAGGGTRKINREFKKASQRLTVELFFQHNNS